MFKIDLDMKSIEQLENDLDRFGKHALPYAVRDMLNTAAYKISDLSKRNIGRKFINRNAFTKRSVSFQRTNAKKINQMEAVIGSTQEYMAKQEEGFVTRKRGKHGVAVPTTEASGESGARVRRRQIRRANRLSNIRIAKGLTAEYHKKYKSPRQRLIRMVQDAIEHGFRTIFWMSKRSKRVGFYRVQGGRRTKRGFPEGAKLKMIYSVSKPSTVTKSHEWLHPSVKYVMRNIDDLYAKALRRQIEKNRSFRNRK